MVIVLSYLTVILECIYYSQTRGAGSKKIKRVSVASFPICFYTNICSAAASPALLPGNNGTLLTPLA
jgi:hypothetical protein